MSKKVKNAEEVQPSTAQPASVSQPVEPTALFEQMTKVLSTGLSQAIETSKPPQRKTVLNRKKNSPWTPKDGSPKLKLKIKCYQHGLELREERLFNEQIALLNRLRPGIYLNGYVKVIRRRDRGLNIDYPMRTAAQRMRLSADFGITNLTDLLKRLVEEGDKRPKNVEFDERD